MDPDHMKGVRLLSQHAPCSLQCLFNFRPHTSPQDDQGQATGSQLTLVESGIEYLSTCPPAQVCTPYHEHPNSGLPLPVSDLAQFYAPAILD